MEAEARRLSELGNPGIRKIIRQNVRPGHARMIDDDQFAVMNSSSSPLQPDFQAVHLRGATLRTENGVRAIRFPCSTNIVEGRPNT